MEMAILAAGLFVFLAHLLDLVFRATKIPDILVLMIVGVIAGQALEVSTITTLKDVGQFVAVVTLVVILFQGGLGLKIREVLQAAKRATPFALLSMAGAVAMMTGVLYLYLGPPSGGSLDTTTCLLGALILGGTSSAVVIPMLNSLGTRKELSATLTLESALTDVVCIIGTVGIVTSLSMGSAPSAGGLLGDAVFSLVLAALSGFISGVIWTGITAASSRMKSNKLTTLAFALVLYGLAEKVGISGAITALTFGITLNNLPTGIRLRLQVSDTPITLDVTEMTGQERKLYEEVVFLLKAFFFFYLGLTVEPGDFLSGSAMLALVLALVPFIPRFPVLFILDRKTTPRRDALIAWSLVPRGLAAAVLAQYAVGKGVPHAESLAQVVNLMVFLSITAVAVSVFLIERGKLDSLGQVALTWFPETLAEPSEVSGEEASKDESTATQISPVAALDAPAPPSPPPEPAAAAPTESAPEEPLQTVTVDLRPAPGPDAPDEEL
ncbi:MAG: hypothetical protein CL940_10840 [Deltaproteobacteria bacterium]|nr:hypothetical protein [Deltaproteobacteria bacterium]